MWCIFPTSIEERLNELPFFLSHREGELFFTLMVDFLRKRVRDKQEAERFCETMQRTITLHKQRKKIFSITQ